MSIQLTNFTQNYQSAVSQIKQIKQINQNLQSYQLPKSSSSTSSLSSSSSQLLHYQQKVKQSSNKVQYILLQIQKSYVDPQTARKLELIKQQLSRECQRNRQLINSIRSNINNKGKNNGNGSNKNSRNHSTNDSVQQITHSQQDQQQYIFDHDTQSRLNKQKTQQLNKAQSKLLNIHNITQQTNKLVYQQGQNIDIIDQNIGTTLTNTKQTNKYLEQANKQQKKGMRKYVWLAGLIGILVVFIVGLVLFLK